MNSNVYNINWATLGWNFLPVALRRPLLFGFVRSLLRPVELLHGEFLTFRTESLYKVRHNSQIVYMEAVLNDAFDPELRRIRIANAVFKTPVYFYEPEENREVWFYEPADNNPVYFNEQNEFAGDGVDFSVLVPPALQPGTEPAELAMLTKMRGLVDNYKLYSKNYNILWQLSA